MRKHRDVLDNSLVLIFQKCESLENFSQVLSMKIERVFFHFHRLIRSDIDKTNPIGCNEQVLTCVHVDEKKIFFSFFFFFFPRFPLRINRRRSKRKIPCQSHFQDCDHFYREEKKKNRDLLLFFLLLSECR